MNSTGRLAFIMAARMLACLLIVAASAATFVATAHAQDLCSNPLYLDPAAGEDVEGCGTADAPCGTLSYVGTLALSCSAQLGEEITIMQYTGPDYAGEIAVGVANPTGLAGEPLTTGVGDEATTEDTTEGADTAPDAEAESGEEAATTESEADPADETAETTAAEGEEAAEEDGPAWTVSRRSAFYSVLALFLGIVVGVVISYGMNSGDSSKQAATAAVLLLAMGAAFTPSTVWAQEQCPGEFVYFAPETGQDAEACGTLETPCQTFEYAIAQAETCSHSVTIYQNETPIFLLDLTSELTDAGASAVSESEVTDAAEEDGAVEEAAEDVAAEAVEAVSDASELTEEAVDELLDAPVGDIDDWIWWIGMAALGVVLGYAAHAVPSAKLDS